MMPCNPPITPYSPMLVWIQQHEILMIGSLGAFAHDSLHTRKGGDPRPHESLHMLPSSQTYKNNNKNIILHSNVLGIAWVSWEDY